jgi:hypothetical protein
MKIVRIWIVALAISALPVVWLGGSKKHRQQYR